MSGLDNTDSTGACSVERVGGQPVLSDSTEIDIAFAARDALNPLGAAAQYRVLTWVAESFGLVVASQGT